MQPAEKTRPARMDGGDGRVGTADVGASRSAVAVGVAHLAILLLRGIAIALLAAPIVILLALILR